MITDKCVSCGKCVKACPFNAITFQNEDYSIDYDLCTLCGMCVDICPVDAIELKTNTVEKESDAAADAPLLVFCVNSGPDITPVDLELIGKGRELADSLKAPLYAFFTSPENTEVPENLLRSGADRIYHSSSSFFNAFNDALLAETLKFAVEKLQPGIVLGGATVEGRSVLPRVAALLGTGLTADCTVLSVDSDSGQLIQTRPAFGGNIMATILCRHQRPQMATVRPGVFKPLPKSENTSEIQFFDISEISPKLQRHAESVQIIETVSSSDPSEALTGADVVVTGGRALKNPANFELLKKFASILGGAVGATRAAVDEGMVGFNHQVGQTGRTISPKLYIGCGVSGAIQHLAGMQGADRIISINRDPNAPIHSIADLAVVGDLFEILPETMRRLKAEEADAQKIELSSSIEASKEHASSNEHESLNSKKDSSSSKSSQKSATISGADLLKLEKIVGDGNLIVTAEDMQPYSHDESPGLHSMPDAVVRVQNHEQAVKIMKLASERGFPIVPRGAGTGLSGGAVPIHGGLVLSTENMNSIIDLDPSNMTLTVEPGVVTGNLQKFVEDHGLYYPPDPASLDSCSIGGNVAENAGGPRAVKYGVTRHWILGMESIMPDGSVISTGGSIIKNVAGFDLQGLLIGSEGTLGLITKLTLKLIPRPEHIVDMLVPFNSLSDACHAVTEVIKRQCTPAAVEFMEKSCIEACDLFLGRPNQFPEAEAQLILELDGFSESAVNDDLHQVADLLMEKGAYDVAVAKSKQDRERLWRGRRVLLESIKAISPELEVEDVCVPRAVIPEFIAATTKIQEEFGLRVISFGHAGDGNIHVHILKDDCSEEKWHQTLPAMREAMFRRAVELGGSISGEHGIGCVKLPFLDLQIDRNSRDVMRAIKKSIDPSGIMNPGKAI